VDVIATSPEAPTFQNTIAALEDAGRHQGRAETLFSVLTSNLNTKEVQAIDREWAPKMAEAYDKITFNDQLFARISAVHAARESSGLTAEQRRLVERLYDRFVRAGAKLSPDQKKKLGNINQALAVAFTDFGNKVLADEDTWVVLEKKEDLAGLSESLEGLVQGGRGGAQARGQVGWSSTRGRASIRSSTSSSRRDLREKVWKAFKNRGDNGNESDTNATIAKIVKLRAERARCSATPPTPTGACPTPWRRTQEGQELMMKVWPAAVARVLRRSRTWRKIAQKDKVSAIEPWDYLYYAEKVRKAKYALDQDELKDTSSSTA
jgi:peptidyl-dipeptidase Dcp